MTHLSKKTTVRSSDKHGSGAVTTNQLEQKTVEVPQEQIVKTTPTTQQVTDQSATIEQFNTAATESTIQHEREHRVVCRGEPFAKLNESGFNKVTTDRERRAVEIAKQKVDHSF